MTEGVEPIRPPDEDRAVSRNARIGLVLFAAYLLLYGGFVAVSAFAPQLMSRLVFAGINLAIVYGMLLIVAALVLALIYMAVAKPAHDRREGHL